MPKIRRSFFLTCLALTIAAAVALTLFYRHVSVQALVHVTEADNEVLAYETLRALSPALADYLATLAEVQSAQLDRPLPPPLATAIAKILERKDIREIAIYNRAGKVVYSTEPNEPVGSDHAGNPGVKAALAGKVANEFLYRDTLSQLDFATAHDNLVQSYIPISLPGESRVLGVFELYSDVNDVVHVLERTELLVMLGGLIGFSVLTGALYAVFRRAGEVIESAQLAVENDKRTLSRASLSVLHSEETSRERIATDLLGGVVQTLSAVKLSVESAAGKAAAGKLPAHDPHFQSVIPVLQEVIDALAALAAKLHPASMQELGLLPALYRVCDEFKRAHPSIDVESAIQVSDEQVPQHLKITIYRTVQSILEYVGRQRRHGRVKARLALEQRGLELRMELGRTGAQEGSPSPATDPSGTQEGIEQVRERIILSGGTFSVHGNSAGDGTLLATWLLDSEPSAATGV